MNVQELRDFAKTYSWGVDSAKPYIGNGRSEIDRLVTLKSGKKATEIPSGQLIDLIQRKMNEDPFRTICNNLGNLMGLDYQGTATVPAVDGKQEVNKAAAQILVDQITDFTNLIEGILPKFIGDLNHIKQQLICFVIHPDNPEAIDKAFKSKPLVLDDTIAIK